MEIYWVIYFCLKQNKKNRMQVASIQGVWRVLVAAPRGGRFLGLSTSRALGDLSMKRPKALVIANPTVHVHTLHFDKDAFLVSYLLGHRV